MSKRNPTPYREQRSTQQIASYARAVRTVKDKKKVREETKQQEK
jgi:hypothetical protein